MSASGSMRVAVVGAGPAGFYLAEGLLGHELPFTVDMFDRLSTPWGLVRAGVAPDHPKIKAVSRRYEATAALPGFRFLGNVEVGRDLSHEQLAAHYHAVVYTTGAAESRGLGIPGEELPGSVSATDFVAWYNGHPDAAELQFDLSHPRAVVVGNGNVALDVARMLMAREEDLARTDIADQALQVLRSHAVREVMVLGRRGPAQATFTTPELKELATLTDAEVLVEGAVDLEPPAEAESRVKRNLEVLREYAATTGTEGRRKIVLRFLSSPVEILGDGRVEALRVAHNRLMEQDGRLRAQPTGETETLEAGLVVRAVGYRGRAIPGVPYDEHSGTISNQDGRVLAPDSDDALPGVYVAGWAKRGPSGIIGTNKRCANLTLESLVSDARAGRLPAPAADADVLQELLDGHPVVDQQAWQSIDAHERAAGEEQGRPRVKLVRREELLDRALSASGGKR